MIYTVLSVIFIAIEAALIGYFIWHTVKYKKPFSKATLWYALPVFLVVYALYVMAHIYSGGGWSVFALLNIVSSSLEAFVLKLDDTVITPLATDNALYLVAMAVALVLAGATLAASVITLWGYMRRNAYKVGKAIAKNCDIVLGNSPSALRYAKNNNAVIISFEGEDKAEELVLQGYNAVVCNLNDKKDPIVKKIINKKVKKSLSGVLRKQDDLSQQMQHFIAFADNELNYVELIEWFASSFGGSGKGYYTLHIEASLEDMDIINRKFIDTLKKYDNICVKSFNRHELLARKFVVEHPISSSVPEEFYSENRTIAPQKKINVIFLGFGKVNYELMKLMVMQNQFVELGEDGKRFHNHPVNYYLFDNSNDKLYSDLLMLLQSGLRKISSPDLPPPEEICRIKTCRELNVYSQEFADEFEKIVGDPDSYSYVMVSIGGDCENMAFAEHLADFYSGGRVKFFTRIKDTKRINSASDRIIAFGYENDLYTHSVLVNDELDGIALDINKAYNNNKSLSDAIRDFNGRPTIEVYSNIYHAASISFKMGLLKLKYVNKNEVPKGVESVTQEQLYQRYTGFSEDGGYDKYAAINVWSMLGYSEHSRWVAQYLLKGYRPMPFAEIKVIKNGNKLKIVTKDHMARKHCCLTDFYSLDVYHKHIADLWTENGITKSRSDKDVETYQYDYIMVHDNYESMIKNGYALINIAE